MQFTHRIFSPRTLLLSIGVLGLVFAAFNATRFFTASAPAAADFTCPVDTECPYDSSGTFVGYKKPWPPGCVYVIPGLPVSESGKQTNTENLKWNQADRNSSTTAPQCYPEGVSAYGFKYYGRGVRMHNVGVRVDRTTGLFTKFNADGSFAGTECFFPEKCGDGTTSSSNQTTNVTQTAVQGTGSTASSGVLNGGSGQSFPLAVGILPLSTQITTLSIT
jgi:hypothetical protein